MVYPIIEVGIMAKYHAPITPIISHARPHNRALLREFVAGRWSIRAMNEPLPEPCQRASPRERSRFAYIFDFDIALRSLEVNLCTYHEADAITVIVGVIIYILIQEVIAVYEELHAILNTECHVGM